jgi:hypothetical protein
MVGPKVETAHRTHHDCIVFVDDYIAAVHGYLLMPSMLTFRTQSQCSCAEKETLALGRSSPGYGDDDLRSEHVQLV